MKKKPVNTSIYHCRHIPQITDKDLTDRVIRTANPAERYRTRIVKKLSLSFFRRMNEKYRDEMLRRMSQ